MSRVSIGVVLALSLVAGGSHGQQDDRFVQPDDPPPGQLLDAQARSWAIDITPAFGEQLRVGRGVGVRRLYVYREGIVGFGARVNEGLLEDPQALDALAPLRVVAPFWARIDSSGEANAWGANQVFALVEPGRVWITWHEVLPAGFEPLSQPVSFALRLEQLADGLALEFHYLDAGPTGAFEPRAGYVFDAVQELFRAPSAEELEDGLRFAVPADRAKALFEQGSDDEPGVWRFELGLDGQVRGDRDEDGVRDAFDNCPWDPNPLQLDLDRGGGGDVCDDDDDGDGIRDIVDNCPRHPNAEQRDLDRDGAGDICDGDRDGDGFPDSTDNCPERFQTRQHDLDRDGQGDVCDTDVDGDDEEARARLGRPVPDNCPGVYEPTRKDSDRDGLGDVCDLRARWSCRPWRCAEESDWDGDGIGDAMDVCPFWPDPEQLVDKNGDGLACRRPVSRLEYLHFNAPREFFVPRIPAP